MDIDMQVIKVPLNYAVCYDITRNKQGGLIILITYRLLKHPLSDSLIMTEASLELLKNKTQLTEFMAELLRNIKPTVIDFQKNSVTVSILPEAQVYFKANPSGFLFKITTNTLNIFNEEFKTVLWKKLNSLKKILYSKVA